MRIEQAIQSALVGAGFRAYQEFLPAGVTYPAITFQRVSTVRGTMLSGVDTLTEVRIQLDIWGRSVSDVQAVGVIVRSLFEGARGNFEGLAIQYCALESEQSLSDLEGDKETRRLSLDFVFSLHES